MTDEAETEANDHFCLSLTAFLWCLPLGLAALILSHKTMRYNQSNDYDQAAKTSKQAYYLAVSGIVAGIFTVPLLFFALYLLKK